MRGSGGRGRAEHSRHQHPTPRFDWKDSLELGVAAMDREHKELVAAMNHIHALDQGQADQATLDRAFVRLVDLTRKHFADEEQHMAAIGYPGRERHALIHGELLRKVAAHHAAFRAGTGRVAPEFFDFLVLWLTAHITGIDRKYATHRQPAKV